MELHVAKSVCLEICDAAVATAAAVLTKKKSKKCMDQTGNHLKRGTLNLGTCVLIKSL